MASSCCPWKPSPIAAAVPSSGSMPTGNITSVDDYIASQPKPVQTV